MLHSMKVRRGGSVSSATALCRKERNAIPHSRQLTCVAVPGAERRGHVAELAVCLAFGTV